MTQNFILDGLNCANCAAKIEAKLRDTAGYGNVSFSFATKELSLDCDRADIQSEIQSIVDSIEDGVTVRLPEEEESEEDGGRLKLILLIAGGVMFAAAFALHFFEGFELPCVILSALAVLASGYDVIIEGVRSAFRLRLDETTLMTVAVAAAMALGDFVEAAAVTVLFGIGEYLEDLAVEKSRRDIRKLTDIRPDTAVIYEDGAARTVRAESVPVGTTVQIAPHTRVPLDGVVISGESSVDASSLTGESAPISVRDGSELLSGMMNRGGTVLMRTTKPYSDSAATRIVKLVEESARSKSDGEKLITRFARIYTPSVILIAVVIAVVPSLITGDWLLWLRRALACLVASCPCSIVISVPLAYYAGIGAASKLGMLIKGGRFIEAMSAAKAFCFDKTGTLTEDKISVAEIKSISSYPEEEILRLAASVELKSAHPIAAAIRARADELGIVPAELSGYSEKAARGVSAEYNGNVVTCAKAEGSDGVTVSVDGQPIGIITLSESVRPEAEGVLNELRSAGVQSMVMVSGDRREACERAAGHLPLDGIYSELLPEDKVSRVEEAIKSYGSCCFIGDGINDAPVLSRSTCGVAMGMGSDAAIESADMVLSAGSLSPLPKVLRLCRSVINTVKANITFSLSVKALVILLAALGIAPLWLAVIADTGVCLICVLNSVRIVSRS